MTTILEESEVLNTKSDGMRRERRRGERVSEQKRNRDLAEQAFRGMPQEMREGLLGAAREQLEAAGHEATSGRVEEAAIEMCRTVLGNKMAALEEHVDSAMIAEWEREERRRLAPRYPDGVPEDVLARAVTARVIRFTVPGWEG